MDIDAEVYLQDKCFILLIHVFNFFFIHANLCTICKRKYIQDNTIANHYVQFISMSEITKK